MPAKKKNTKKDVVEYAEESSSSDEDPPDLSAPSSVSVEDVEDRGDEGDEGESDEPEEEKVRTPYSLSHLIVLSPQLGHCNHPLGTVWQICQCDHDQGDPKFSTW
jgi:hypothetical protein